MRSFVLLTVALALLASPLAAASPGATLSATASPDTVDVSQGPASVSVLVTLQLHDFSCADDQAFRVTLDANATGDASVTLDAAALTFVVPAGSYAFDDYEAQQSVNATISGAGSVDVIARFSSDGGENCIVPGGFPDANATATIRATDGNAPAPATPTPTPTPASPSPAPPTPSSPTTPTSATPTPSAPANNSTGAIDQLPPGGGYVGDYKPTESKSAVPAPGVIAGIAVLAVAAMVLRRR